MQREIKTERIQLSHIPEGGLFVWCSRIYTVDKKQDEPDYIMCTGIASYWTNNPFDRWQYSPMTSEPFNPYCEVEQLV